MKKIIVNLGNLDIFLFKNKDSLGKKVILF